MELLLPAFLMVIVIFLKGFRKKSAQKPDAAKTESLLLKHKELFDRLFPNPLTREQRLSIVDDSRRTLVIASAGSGKTTTKENCFLQTQKRDVGSFALSTYEKWLTESLRLSG